MGMPTARCIPAHPARSDEKGFWLGRKRKRILSMKITDPAHNRRPIALTRRDMLMQFASGFGMLGLAGLLAEEAHADGSSILIENQKSKIENAANPLAPQLPMYPARAKRVIFLFMSGGPSHVDTFDPKPRLTADTGKPLPLQKPHL